MYAAYDCEGPGGYRPVAPADRDSFCLACGSEGDVGRGPKRSGAPIDLLSQRWVIATGRRVDFSTEPWLDGPVGSPDGIGDRWIEEHAARERATLSEPDDAGLLVDMACLTGPGFDAADLDPAVRHFYEHTATWEMDVWSRWSRWAEPGGRAISAAFTRRIRQLALPLDPLDVARGMDSRVVWFTAADGTHSGTAWQRTLRATGATVFGGYYGVTVLPRAARPSIRVVFPLPNGSVTVLLRPEVTTAGHLRLVSPPGTFGQDGAYLIVRQPGTTAGWARRVPLPERFDVYVDDGDELRCEHRLGLGPAECLRLHYRLRARS